MVFPWGERIFFPTRQGERIFFHQAGGEIFFFSPGRGGGERFFFQESRSQFFSAKLINEDLVSGGSRIWWKRGRKYWKDIFNYKFVKKNRYSLFETRSTERDPSLSHSPGGKKMEIRKCLDDFWSTQKSVFCKAILYIHIGKTFLLQNCKNK